jgi:hypothetical protein
MIQNAPTFQTYCELPEAKVATGPASARNRAVTVEAKAWVNGYFIGMTNAIDAAPVINPILGGRSFANVKVSWCNTGRTIGKQGKSASGGEERSGTDDQFQRERPTSEGVLPKVIHLTQNSFGGAFTATLRHVGGSG